MLHLQSAPFAMFANWILALNFSLLIVGTAATLAAFGGETWRRGDEHLVERITTRGWISLLCLVLALSMGISKEILSALETTHSELVAAQRDIKAAAEKRELKDQVDKAQQDSAVARQQLQDVNAALTNARSDLARVLGRLSDAQHAIDHEQRDSFVRGLATTSVTFSNIWLIMPLAEKGAPPQDLPTVFLSALNEPLCRLPPSQIEVELLASGEMERAYLDHLPDWLRGKAQPVADLADVSQGLVSVQDYYPYAPTNMSAQFALLWLLNSNMRFHHGLPAKFDSFYVAHLHYNGAEPAAKFLRELGRDSGPLVITDAGSHESCADEAQVEHPIKLSQAYLVLELNGNQNEIIAVKLHTDGPEEFFQGRQIRFTAQPLPVRYEEAYPFLSGLPKDRLNPVQ